MKTQLLASLATALALTNIFASSAQAVGFSFTTNYTPLSEQEQEQERTTFKGDLRLDSVTRIDNGQTFTDFSLVNSAKIISNDIWTGGNSGAASADMGDEATIGLSQERLTNEGAVTALGNLNLNSIIDTEDKGNFVIDTKFDKAVDNILVFERGKNSRLDIQALDFAGNLIGNLVALPSSKYWTDAGYRIDTMEINNSQKVGSIGLSLADFGLKADDSIFGYRMISRGKDYNGPDWKILGTTDATPTPVPEPTAVIGLGLVAGSFVASRRRQNNK